MCLRVVLVLFTVLGLGLNIVGSFDSDLICWKVSYLRVREDLVELSEGCLSKLRAWVKVRLSLIRFE